MDQVANPSVPQASPQKSIIKRHGNAKRVAKEKRPRTYSLTSRKNRTIFTDEQQKGLYAAYDIDKYPTTLQKELLAQQLGLPPVVVVNWFQHKRQREPVKEKGGYVKNHPRPAMAHPSYLINLVAKKLRGSPSSSEPEQSPSPPDTTPTAEVNEEDRGESNQTSEKDEGPLPEWMGALLTEDYEGRVPTPSWFTRAEPIDIKKPLPTTTSSTADPLPNLDTFPYVESDLQSACPMEDVVFELKPAPYAPDLDLLFTEDES
ncbi:SubName: Full=Uncharacterized protein {ECO:0000313/EMBL:CCA69634.1} [Serendipita indica DSM 11827]|uniref:Homeobox domain-containing protein n=1 Tax=Serendipita indica (strain DSM 11827) TaxID=1109443 RepID=G4TE94_SERID|nr:SubName: Full=Uncharacterized protein {ECO:0000313/EMBL:CCA69634.1} [Serendipita indica DSM 11827]CCA69634.1 hypothetical protein PIIN_03573 [Serendipita indica DSM 11827]